MMKNWGLGERGPQTDKNGPYLKTKKVYSIFGNCSFHAFITFPTFCSFINSSITTTYFIVTSHVRIFDNNYVGS